MPRFSLIVATVDRDKEFAELLDSLERQRLKDLELIVADQNDDDRISQLVLHNPPSYPVKVVRCALGVSRARNIAMEHARGDFIAFPDDDCWYLPDTLAKVNEWFASHPSYSILTAGSRDQDGRVSGNRWIRQDCDLNRVNVFRASATYTVFVRNTLESSQVRFDEVIGPGSGTGIGCGEDADYVLCLMRRGLRGRFNGGLIVGHPAKGLVNALRARAYGVGFGYILRKHALPLLGLTLLGFDVARSLAYRILSKQGRSLELWAHAGGIVAGYKMNRR